MPTKIIDYKLVQGNTPGVLADVVRMLIREGWQPFEPVQHVNGFFVQTMVVYSSVVR